MLWPQDVSVILSELYGKDFRAKAKLAKEVGLTTQSITNLVLGRHNASEETENALIELMAKRYTKATIEGFAQFNGKITELVIPVYPDGANIEKLIGKNWRAPTHRRVMQATAKKLRRKGINAICQEEQE